MFRYLRTSTAIMFDDFRTEQVRHWEYIDNNVNDTVSIYLMDITGDSTRNLIMISNSLDLDLNAGFLIPIV